MKKDQYLIGKYAARTDKRGNTYYIERKTGKRVKADTVGDYIVKRRKESSDALKNRFRRKSGRLISFMDQRLLTDELLMSFGEDFLDQEGRKMTVRDAKDMVRNFSDRAYLQALEAARGMPFLTQQLVVYDYTGDSRELTFDEVWKMAYRLENRKFIFFNEDLNSFSFRQKVRKFIKEKEEEALKEGAETIYRSYIYVQVDGEFNMIVTQSEGPPYYILTDIHYPGND